MKNEEFIAHAKKEVQLFYRDQVKRELPESDVFVVWQCKTLQNHKAILAADGPEQLLFEVTYNGDKQQMYVDTYNKIKNKCVQF